MRDCRSKNSVYSPILRCALHGVMFIKNIPSTIVESGTHPTGSAVLIIGGVAFSYRFSNTFVVLDLVPLVGLLLLVAIALGSSMYC